MNVTWQVEDGYVGGDRPQRVNINEAEIQECDSLQEAQDLVLEIVENEFRNNISWHLDDTDETNAEVERIWNERKKEL